MWLPWHPKRALRNSSTSPDRKMVNCSDRTFSTLEDENRYCIYLKQKTWFSKLLSGIIFYICWKLLTVLCALALTCTSVPFISDLEDSFWIKQKCEHLWLRHCSEFYRRVEVMELSCLFRESEAKMGLLWIKWQACFLHRQLLPRQFFDVNLIPINC